MADDAPSDHASSTRLLALTARIVSAQVRGTKLGAAELPGLVQSVYRALDELTRDPAEVEPPRPEPAVPVRRSVRPDAIACLECGARFRILKRHLATDHGLTPEGYRARWGLPADYPMVAPDYADARSRLAKQAGLGRKRAPEADAEADIPAAEPEPELDLVSDPSPEAIRPEGHSAGQSESSAQGGAGGEGRQEPASDAASDEEAAPPPSAKRRGRRKAATGPVVE